MFPQAGMHMTNTHTTISGSATLVGALRNAVEHLFVAAMTLGLCAAPRAAAQKQDGAGAVISGEASAKDVGLPLYPGSKRHKNKDEDSPAANLGLWGGGSGFKLMVLQMASADSPDKVANFYKKALAKYGTVLDCSHPAASPDNSRKGDSSKNDSSLTCGDDQPDKGEQLFKAGTKQFQHIVAIQPNGSGSLFQILYISAWGTGDRK
jgi:hypothetical protein